MVTKWPFPKEKAEIIKKKSIINEKMYLILCMKITLSRQIKLSICME